MAQGTSVVEIYSISKKYICFILHVKCKKMALRCKLQMPVSSSNRRIGAHGSQFLRAQVMGNVVKYFILRADDPHFFVHMGGGSGRTRFVPCYAN